MKITGFEDAFGLLIGNEGGYSNNPSDPGGETMWGITARVARAHGYSGPMNMLPLETAKSIAKTAYWDAFNGDAIPPELAFQVFDTIYNGGPAVRWLQQAVGAEPDGRAGPATVAAANACDVRCAIMRLDAYRLRYLAGLRTWPEFGRGWVNRVATNLLEGAD